MNKIKSKPKTAPRQETGGDCPSASCCALGRDEFLAWLNERCGSVELVQSFYLEGPRHLDLPDTGDSYCWECAQKQRWANRNKGNKYTRISSENWPEKDSHQFCARCYVPLEHIPTKYQLESEIEHYLEVTDDWNLSETDACLMANLVHFRVDDETWKQFAPVASKILLHNARAMPPATESDHGKYAIAVAPPTQDSNEEIKCLIPQNSTKPLMAGCPPATCSASFGYQWITPLGKRAFCWTIKQGCNGMMLVGCTYNDETKAWDGESTCDIAKALSRPARGRVPDVPQLRRRLQHLIANEIDYTIRPSGTY